MSGVSFRLEKREEARGIVVVTGVLGNWGWEKGGYVFVGVCSGYYGIIISPPQLS